MTCLTVLTELSNHSQRKKLVVCLIGRKPTECPADIEILIKRAISAVPINL